MIVAKRSKRIEGHLLQEQTVQTEKRPAALEFLAQFKGSLPDEITEADLSTVNSALGLLFSRLRQARALFARGHADGGREGTFSALGAVWQFLVLFRNPLQETLHFPILRLQDALVHLEHGHAQLIVKPVRRSSGGRATSGHAYLSLKGHAALAVQQLTDIGLKHPEAREAVAKELRKMGVRTERRSGMISATTVRNWCFEVSSDVGKHGTAAMMHDSYSPEERERLLAMPKDQAKRFVLDSLRNWASLFPEWQRRRKQKSI